MSPLHAAPSCRRGCIDRRVLEGGQGPLPRATLGVGTGVGRGGQEAGQLPRGGGPELGGGGVPQKWPRAQASMQTASVLPPHVGNTPTVCDRHRAVGFLGCYLRPLQGPEPLCSQPAWSCSRSRSALCWAFLFKLNWTPRP